MVERVQLKDIELTRHVRTEAGARRYHKPIGAPLGGGHTHTKKIVHEAKKSVYAKVDKHGPQANRKELGVKLKAHPKKNPLKAKGVALKAAAPNPYTPMKGVSDPVIRAKARSVITQHNRAMDELHNADTSTPKARNALVGRLLKIAPYLKAHAAALKAWSASKKPDVKVTETILKGAVEGVLKSLTGTALGVTVTALGLHLAGL